MEFPSPIPALSSTFGFAHIIDYHAVHNAERPMAVFAPDDSHKPSPVTFFEFGRACQRFARSVAPEAPIAKGEVVALLANCDTIMYMTAISGLIRAGLTVSLHKRSSR
jgi:acyl-CoA synthetase (AMP-forming)/AMP-acid ligase II